MLLMLLIETDEDLDEDQIYWMNCLNQSTDRTDAATALDLISLESSKFLSIRECQKPIPPEKPRKPLQHVCSECRHRFVASAGDLCEECKTLQKIDSRTVQPEDQAPLGRFC